MSRITVAGSLMSQGVIIPYMVKQEFSEFIRAGIGYTNQYIETTFTFLY